MRQLRDPLHCRLISFPEGLESFELTRKDLIRVVLIEYTSMYVKLYGVHELLGVPRELRDVISEHSVLEFLVFV